MTTGEVLTPSDISPIHSGTTQDLFADLNEHNITRYIKQVEDHYTAFKEKWLEFYYKSLLTQKKWHMDAGKTIEMNDLVLILDHKNSFGYPTLGVVVFIQEDHEGLPRYYSIRYKTENKNTLKTLIRTGHNLTLVLKESEDRYTEDVSDAPADVPGYVPDVTADVPDAPADVTADATGDVPDVTADAHDVASTETLTGVSKLRVKHVCDADNTIADL